MRRTRRAALKLFPVLAAIGGVALAACVSRAPPANPGVEQVEEPDDARAAAADTAPGADVATSPRDGKIARADLHRVLDAGPGAFLARAEVKARLDKGQFRGWQVVRSPYSKIDIVPGDVLLSINGRTLEHPVDLERLWRDLRAANAIDVDVDRGGRKFALRFSVVPPM
jgi:S1-C subfamily serine protease